jgi:ribosomal protein L37AE/L43A
MTAQNTYTVVRFSFVLISWLVLSSQLRYNRFFLFKKVVKMADVDRGPTVIVDPAEILPVNDIQAETFNYKNLSFATVRECIDWFARRNLMHNNYVCSACRIQMSLVKRTQTSDGFRWKCKLCGTAASIRSDSFFSRSGGEITAKKTLLMKQT